MTLKIIYLSFSVIEMILLLDKIFHWLSWWNVKLMKCQVDEMSSWWNVKLMKCQVDEMSSW
jgi:hypothetical protein